jgi:hypothetical protein
MGGFAYPNADTIYDLEGVGVTVEVDLGKAGVGIPTSIGMPNGPGGDFTSTSGISISGGLGLLVGVAVLYGYSELFVIWDARKWEWFPGFPGARRGDLAMTQGPKCP